MMFLLIFPFIILIALGIKYGGIASRQSMGSDDKTPLGSWRGPGRDIYSEIKPDVLPQGTWISNNEKAWWETK